MKPFLCSLTLQYLGRRGHCLERTSETGRKAVEDGSDIEVHLSANGSCFTKAILRVTSLASQWEVIEDAGAKTLETGRAARMAPES